MSGEGQRGLLLGVGNVHRRDDGVGPVLVERLAPRLAPCWRAVLERGDDVAALLAAWEHAGVAFVVDAALADAPPGTLTIHGETVPFANGHRDPSSHGFGLREAIALSQALGVLPADFAVLSVTGRDFGHGEGFSPGLAARLDALTAEVAAALPPGALVRQ